MRSSGWAKRWNSIRSWAVTGACVPAAFLASPSHAGRAGGGSSFLENGEVHRLVSHVLRSDDHRGRPFAVVDKKHALLYVFERQGRLVGATSVLLGQAVGDRAWPGVGDKPPSQLLAHERTTPAGRFDSEPGVNLQGEDVVWFDYDAALALHRVRPGTAESRRLQALATPQAVDNRQSLGCVVVPVRFYESVVRPVLGRARGVVYVLPEDGRADRLLDALTF